MAIDDDDDYCSTVGSTCNDQQTYLQRKTYLEERKFMSDERFRNLHPYIGEDKSEAILQFYGEPALFYMIEKYYLGAGISKDQAKRSTNKYICEWLKLEQKLQTSVQSFGYHKTKIDKGVLGEFSKIREEFEELADAINQENKIMAMCELADLYGAIESYAKSFGLAMSDLEIMAKATRRAFENGDR